MRSSCFLRRLTLLGLAFALLGCASPLSSPASATMTIPARQIPASQTSSPRPTLPAQPLPSTSTPELTVPDLFSTATPYALSATPFHEPWPSPVQFVGWKRFENAALNLTFLYPPDWVLESDTRASGKDGFFEISSQSYASASWCVIEANGPDSFARYGVTPFILPDVARQVEGGSGCSVVPAQPAIGLQSVLYLRGLHPTKTGQTIIFRADSGHFDALVSSIGFLEPPASPPASSDANNLGCLALPDNSAATVQTFQGLTVTEYPVANETCNPWQDTEGFSLRSGARDMRISFVRSGLLTKMEQANQSLALFGYHLAEFPGDFLFPIFTLFKGEDIVVENMVDFAAVSVKADGSDFLFWGQVEESGQSFVVEVRRDSVRRLEPAIGFNTVWVGNDLLSYRYSREQIFYIGYPARIDVFSNDKEIARIAIPRMGPAGSPVRGLWEWQGQWLMEIQGALFQNGEHLNKRLGYGEIFDWHLVSGKPFFLMRQGDTFGVVYDGQELPVRYRDIIHGDLCCSAAALSVLSSTDGALFYALHDGIWFLVKIVDER